MENTKTKKATLIIIDMQNDFITGALANPDAEKIVDPICELIKGWKGNIIATRDTHDYNYLNTAEGKKLPIEHCISDTPGWCIEKRIARALGEVTAKKIVNKYNSFGLGWSSNAINNDLREDVYIVGTCTDICVISNALVLKTVYPYKNFIVYEDLCAGTTPEMHKEAINVMKSCQIDILTYSEKKQG